MTESPSAHSQYCNDSSAATETTSEQGQTRSALECPCELSIEVVTKPQNASQLGAVESKAIQELTHQLSAEIYTQQLELIIKMSRTGATGYKIATKLKSQFGSHALSQKSVYNELTRLKLGLASFRGARQRKTRHR